MRIFLTLSAILAASPLSALTPLLPCDGVVESGMRVGDLRVLGQTGLVIETYAHNAVTHGDLVEFDTAPAEALSGFAGNRITHCASGRMIAFHSGRQTDEVAAALGATEFLRAKIKGDKPASAGDMSKAVRAVYGDFGSEKPIELRETEETCGCNAYFPGLRPKGLTPYGQRGN